MIKINLYKNCKSVLLMIGLLMISSYLFCQQNMIFYVNHPNPQMAQNYPTVKLAVTAASEVRGHKYIYICPEYNDNVPVPTVFSEDVEIFCSGQVGFTDEYEIRGLVPAGYNPKDYVIFDNGINPVDGTPWGVPAFKIYPGSISTTSRNTVIIADMTIQRTKTGDWVCSDSPGSIGYEEKINNGGIAVYDRDVCIINVRFGKRSEQSNYAYAIKCREQPGKGSHIFQINNCLFTEACDIGKQAIYTFVELTGAGQVLTDYWYNVLVSGSIFKDNGNSILIRNSETYFIKENTFINDDTNLIESSIAVDGNSTHENGLFNIEFFDNLVKNHKIGVSMDNINHTLMINNQFIDNVLSLDWKSTTVEIVNNLFVANNEYVPERPSIGINNSESGNIIKLYKNTFFNRSISNISSAIENHGHLPTQYNHSNIFWNFDRAVNSNANENPFYYCCYNGLQMNGDASNLFDSPNTHVDDINNPWYNQEIPENYLLVDGSICIDRGHPNPNFNREDYTLDKEDREPDDSRYDIGYKYFDQSQFDFYYLHGGWNWVCFPKLVPDTQNGFETPFDVFSPMFGAPARFDKAYTKRGIHQLYFSYNGPNVPYNDEIHELFQYETYKIGLGISNTQYYTLKKPGVRIAPDTPIDLIAGQDNYIGYFPSDLPVTYTTIKDAFGDNLRFIKSIRAERWTWIDMNSSSKGDTEPVPSMENRIIKPKEGLVINVKEDINGFVWQNLPPTQPVVPVLLPEFFTVKDNKEYEVIDIMSVENPEGLSEIAVFEDSVCVGAIKVESLPVQLLAFTSAVNGAKDTEPLSFQLHYEGKSNENQTISYQLWNQKTDQYQAELLYGGKNNYSRVRLGKAGNSVNPAQQAVLHNCYPNPFNPTTTISWSMPAKGMTEISVYNIKGQKVKTLACQEFDKGKHQLIWNGKNTDQQSVSSGIYFIRLEHNGKNQTKKVILMK